METYKLFLDDDLVVDDDKIQVWNVQNDLLRQEIIGRKYQLFCYNAK